MPQKSAVDAKTVSDFGEQWTTYTDNSGYYGSLSYFEDICAPLLTADDVRGRRVADIGSGTGRIVNMLLDAGAAHVTAIEPSDSFSVVAANTAARAGRVEIIHADGAAIPQDRGFDLVVSIGVLHHIEDPNPVIVAARKALRPGGTIFIWLYGREGNEAYLAAAHPLRVITKRLPSRALAALCYLIDAIALTYAWLCRALPLPMRNYARNVYAKLAPDKRRLVIFDQLNPAYAKYYRQDEARALLERNGFVDVSLHHRRGYSWSVIGRSR